MNQKDQYIWTNRLVKLFAKEVILAATVPVLVLLLTNPMHFDLPQKIYAALAVLFIALFTAHTLEKSHQAILVPPSGNSITNHPAPSIAPKNDLPLPPEKVFANRTPRELLAFL